ncbi:WXG100-like domain-containing protein [Kitasatospora sp. NPDC001159]
MGESTAAKAVQKLTGMWWPDADPDKLRKVADAWDAMATAIDNVTVPTNQAAAAIVVNNHGPAIDAFGKFWGQYYGGKDSAGKGKGWLPETADACRALAKALRDFAHEVDKAIKKLEEEAAIVGATLVAGTALAFFTAGISEGIATGAAASIVATAGSLGIAVSETIATIATTVLVGAAFGAVEAITVDLAVAQPIRVELFDDGGYSAKEALDSAETGGIMGGAGGGLGAGGRVVSTAAEVSDNASVALAAAGKVASAADTIPGRMVTGAGLTWGYDATFQTGPVMPLDIVLGAVGAAAGPSGKGVDTAKRIADLSGEGHAPGRHVKANDAALQTRLGTTMTNPDGSPKIYTQASNNAGHVKSKDHIDPLTGTTVDGEHGGVHKCGPYATRYDDPADLVAVDKYMRKYIRENGRPLNSPVPIEDILGPEGHKRFTGFYKDPQDPSRYLPVDFEGGEIATFYEADADGKWHLVTSYANPAPGKHP